MKFWKKLLRQLRSSLGYNNNFRYYTLNGILFTVVTVFTRTFAPKFMDRLGATSLHYSLLNALPGLVAVLTTIPGILYIQNSSNREQLMRKFFYISRFFPLVFLFIPYLPESSRAYYFVILFSLMNLPESIGQASLQSWTGSIFRPYEVAEALSVRNRMSQLVMVGATLFMGFVLSLPRSGDNAAVILVYQILFVVSVLFGVLEIKTLRRIKTVRSNEGAHRITLGPAMLGIFRHRPFAVFMACSLLFHFGWQMGWPLFSYYQITVLQADEKWLTIFNVINALFMTLSYSFWSAFIRRRGMKLTTAVVCLGMATSPVLAVSAPSLMAYGLVCVTLGFFTSGTTVVILGSLLESARPEEALLCSAVHQTLTNLTLFASPFLGELFLRLYGVKTAMYVSGLIRLLGALAFFLRWYLAKKGPSGKALVSSGSASA